MVISVYLHTAGERPGSKHDRVKRTPPWCHPFLASAFSVGDKNRLVLNIKGVTKEGRKEMFYLTTHSTHYIYGYMASNIW